MHRTGGRRSAVVLGVGVVSATLAVGGVLLHRHESPREALAVPEVVHQPPRPSPATPTASASVTSSPTSTSARTTKAAPTRPSASAAPDRRTSSPVAGTKLGGKAYPLTLFAAQAAQWRSSRPADAAVMRKLASVPIAQWYGADSTPLGIVRDRVDAFVGQAAGQRAVPTLVIYSIPHRDCGSYSAGGSPNLAAYDSYVRRVAAGIAGRRAIVILEPDALTQGPKCLSKADDAARLAALAAAVRVLAARGASVYLDAGNSRWLPVDQLADRLRRAGVAKAAGFSLNVSNFYSTADEVAYGRRVSAATGGKHFVVDTSRNGRGSLGNQWCNPPGRALGARPTTATGNPLVDAFLWVKTPGQSDGLCLEYGQHDPPSGTFMPEYVLGLARRAGW